VIWVACFLGLVGLAVLVGLLDWRRGLLFCVPVGFFQDPARKLVSGRPVIFVVMVAICFVACLAGAVLKEHRFSVTPLLGMYPRLRAPINLFLLVLAAQTLMTVLRTGNLVLAGLGLLSYVSPLLALLLGFYFEGRHELYGSWLKVYLAGALLAGVTVLLQFRGFSPTVFDAIGVDIVYGRSGVVRMMSGIMRSSEIAAWHLGAAACLMVPIVVSARRISTRVFALACEVGLVVALLLTGRRKMLAALAVYLMLFLLFSMTHRRGIARSARAAIVLLFAAMVVVQLVNNEEGAAGLTPYVERGETLIWDAGDRLSKMSVGLLVWVYRENGFFGSGAGTGTQGAQYFGGGSDIVGGAAEGGLGKVLAELGIPGFLVVLWLSIELFRALVFAARRARSLPSSEAGALYGVLAFIPANAAVFLTAHQVFGDPFVLIVLGFLAGVALSPRRSQLPARSARASRPPMTSGVDRRRGSVVVT